MWETQGPGADPPPQQIRPVCWHPGLGPPPSRLGGNALLCCQPVPPPPPPGRGAVLPQRREPQQRTAAGWAVSYLQATVRQAPRTQDSEASSSECVKHAGCPCVLRISRRTVSASQPWACFGPRALQPLRRAVWWFL